MSNIKIIKTEEEFKIFADPYRMKIMSTFGSNKNPMTVKMVADEMGEVPANVHYHVKKLLKIGLIELDHIEVINGINAKYYKKIVDDIILEISKDQPQEMMNMQMDLATNALLNTVDLFKDAVRERAIKIKSAPEERKNDGFLLVDDVYLSEEDYNEYYTLVKSFLDTKSTKGKGKSKYKTISGLIKSNK